MDDYERVAEVNALQETRGRLDNKLESSGKADVKQHIQDERVYPYKASQRSRSQDHLDKQKLGHVIPEFYQTVTSNELLSRVFSDHFESLEGLKNMLKTEQLHSVVCKLMKMIIEEKSLAKDKNSRSPDTRHRIENPLKKTIFNAQSHPSTEIAKKSGVPLYGKNTSDFQFQKKELPQKARSDLQSLVQESSKLKLTNSSKNLIENKFENYTSNKSNIDIGLTRGHINKVGANRPSINRSVSKRSKDNIKTKQNSDLPVDKELGSFDKSNFSINLTYGSQVNSSLKDNEVANKATSQSKSNADAPVAQSIGLSFEKIAEKRGSEDTSQNKIQSTTKVRRDTKSSGELINKDGHQELSVPLKDNQASLLSYPTSRQSPVQNGKTLNVSFGNQSNSAKSEAKQAENYLDNQTQAVLTFGKDSSIGRVINGPIKGHSQGHRSRDSHGTGAMNHKPSNSRASGYRDELARVTSMASYNSHGTQQKISAQDIYKRLNRDDAYDFQKKAAPIKAIDARSTLRYETQAADHVDANGYYGQTSPEDADFTKDGNYLKKYARGSSLSGERPTMNSSNGETGVRDSNSRHYGEKYIDLKGGIQNITSKSTNQESQAYLDGVLYERRQRYYRKDVNQNLVNFNNGDFRSKRSATDQSTGVLKPVTAKSLANVRPSDEEHSPETIRNKIKSMMRNENDKSSTSPKSSKLWDSSIMGQHRSRNQTYDLSITPLQVEYDLSDALRSRERRLSQSMKQQKVDPLHRHPEKRHFLERDQFINESHLI